jgi:hypothetical protein
MGSHRAIFDFSQGLLPIFRVWAYQSLSGIRLLLEKAVELGITKQYDGTATSSSNIIKIHP